MVNKVIIIGSCGRDAEVKFMPNGSAVANVSIATSRKWKSKDGERQEETTWHRVTFFDKLAEVAGNYLKKGKQCYVEGRLQNRDFTDKDGVKRSVTEIVANEMTLLGGKDDAPQKPAAKPQASKATFDDMKDVDLSSDIPF